MNTIVIFRPFADFFGDLGLPPIAEAPRTELAGPNLNIIPTLFAAVYYPILQKTVSLRRPFNCPFVLPFVLQAIDPGTIRLKSYFSSQIRKKEAASLLESQGQLGKAERICLAKYPCCRNTKLWQEYQIY